MGLDRPVTLTFADEVKNMSGDTLYINNCDTTNVRQSSSLSPGHHYRKKKPNPQNYTGTILHLQSNLFKYKIVNPNRNVNILGMVSDEILIHFMNSKL